MPLNVVNVYKWFSAAFLFFTPLLLLIQEAVFKFSHAACERMCRSLNGVQKKTAVLGERRDSNLHQKNEMNLLG